MDAQNYIDSLKHNKKRITPGRKEIIEIFCKASSPLAADHLIKNTKLNKTSIYREIAFLLNQNIISSVDFSDGVMRYELKDLEHHHHLICIGCKSVRDVVLTENLDSEEKRIQMVNNFHIKRHNLEFFGYCQNCFT